MPLLFCHTSLLREAQKPRTKHNKERAYPVFVRLYLDFSVDSVAKMS